MPASLIQTLEAPPVAAYPDSLNVDLLLKFKAASKPDLKIEARPAGEPGKIVSRALPVSLIALSGLTAWLMGKVSFQNFWNISLGLLIEVIPFLLSGAILAALIAPLRPGDLKIWKLATRNRANATVTALGMGLLLPVCECGTASIARQANRAGAPAGMSIVFLLAAPILNPVTLLVTYLAFQGDWLIILGRAGLALVVALTVGLILSWYPRPNELFVPAATPGAGPDDHDHDGHHHAGPPVHDRLHPAADSKAAPAHRPGAAGFNNFLERAAREFMEALRVVLPGISLAAAFQACVPSHYFLDLGQGALFSAVALMLLAGLMSICSSADAFVALSFAGLLPTGSILAFLVFGPLINLKSIFLFRLVLTWRAIGLLALLCFSLVLVAAVFFNYWLA